MEASKASTTTTSGTCRPDLLLSQVKKQKAHQLELNEQVMPFKVVEELDLEAYKTLLLFFFCENCVL
ncbi:hypothetical protein CMV_024236 [Castanea mollissima]|uniref:Uncharacterized protein n=1 Tax=Castanea mollissima TaxID=60419 RepID=A0A8J4QIJ8_9ROSI|nr:hypothetical protein CMV_024236 [Castanea mollissima]